MTDGWVERNERGLWGIKRMIVVSNEVVDLMEGCEGEASSQ